MKALRIRASTKREGLQKFQKAGYALFDATYAPVNRLSRGKRNHAVSMSFDTLVEDLRRNANKHAPIILIKANVRRILEKKMIANGFNVKNNGRAVPFPAYGHQAEFIRAIRAVF